MSDLEALRDAATAALDALSNRALKLYRDWPTGFRMHAEIAVMDETATLRAFIEPSDFAHATGALVPRVEAHGEVEAALAHLRYDMTHECEDYAFVKDTGEVGRCEALDSDDLCPYEPRCHDENVEGKTYHVGGLPALELVTRHIATLTAERAERDAAFVALWKAAQPHAAQHNNNGYALRAAVEAARPFIEEAL